MKCFLCLNCSSVKSVISALSMQNHWPNTWFCTTNTLATNAIKVFQALCNLKSHCLEVCPVCRETIPDDKNAIKTHILKVHGDSISSKIRTFKRLLEKCDMYLGFPFFPNFRPPGTREVSRKIILSREISREFQYIVSTLDLQHFNMIIF